jgi:hypothetical protein
MESMPSESRSSRPWWWMAGAGLLLSVVLALGWLILAGVRLHGDVLAWAFLAIWLPVLLFSLIFSPKAFRKWGLITALIVLAGLFFLPLQAISRSKERGRLNSIFQSAAETPSNSAPLLTSRWGWIQLPDGTCLPSLRQSQLDRSGLSIATDWTLDLSELSSDPIPSWWLAEKKRVLLKGDASKEASAQRLDGLQPIEFTFDGNADRTNAGDTSTLWSSIDFSKCERMNLQHLDLPESIWPQVFSSGNLTHLDLTDCNNDDGCWSQSPGRRELRELTVEAPRNMTQGGLATLVRATPKLQRLEAPLSLLSPDNLWEIETQHLKMVSWRIRGQQMEKEIKQFMRLADPGPCPSTFVGFETLELGSEKVKRLCRDLRRLYWDECRWTLADWQELQRWPIWEELKVERGRVTRQDLEALKSWLNEQMPAEADDDESLEVIDRRLTQWLSKNGTRRVELELELLSE